MANSRIWIGPYMHQYHTTNDIFDFWDITQLKSTARLVASNWRKLGNHIPMIYVYKTLDLINDLRILAPNHEDVRHLLFVVHIPALSAIEYYCGLSDTIRHAAEYVQSGTQYCKWIARMIPLPYTNTLETTKWTHDFFGIISVFLHLHPTTSDFWYPYLYAVLKNDVATVELLFNHPTFEPNMDHGQAIRIAAFVGHANLVRLMLTKPEIDPSLDSEYALQNACSNGHTKVVKIKYLLRDIRVKPASRGNYALRTAVYNNHLPIVNLLS